MRLLRIVLAVGLMAGAGLPALAQFTDDEVAQREAWEKFMLEAEVAESKQMSETVGVTEPYRLTLKVGDKVNDAVWKNPKGRLKGFIEGWQYEIVAYRLDKYLGLNMVPPTVERRFDKNLGSCQLWVETWSDLRQTTLNNQNPPSDRVGHWNKMAYMQRAFDNLIANDDRHLGNILITEDWRMVLIDHSRSFRSAKKDMKKLKFDASHKSGPKVMKKLPREFLEKIKSLDTEKMTEIAGKHLTAKEIEAVLARKDLILAEMDRLIAENGEENTLY